MAMSTQKKTERARSRASESTVAGARAETRTGIAGDRAERTVDKELEPSPRDRLVKDVDLEANDERHGDEDVHQENKRYEHD